MTEQIMTVDSAVAQFAEPVLASLRPELIDTWKSSFTDQALADALLANPRLSSRIVTEICASVGQTAEAEPPSSGFRETIGAILVHGEIEFARLLGCVWFRQSILEWVTWNTLSEHLPEVELSAARRALMAVTADAVREAGAPMDVAEDLSDPMVLKQGLICLSAWRQSLPTALGQRLTLFLKVKPAITDPRRAELVTMLAHNLAAQQKLEAKP